MKVKFNNSEEIEITEEEFENLADELINSGWYISNISYSFPGYDDLNNTINSSFSENVTIVGNTKEWGDDIDYDK